MYVIIRTNNILHPNWSGKEWSKEPCKIYSSFEEASQAINSYWYGAYNLGTFDSRQVTFVPMSEKRMQKMIHEKKARL